MHTSWLRYAKGICFWTYSLMLAPTFNFTFGRLGGNFLLPPKQSETPNIQRIWSVGSSSSFVSVDLAIQYK
ncbi:hypothetical protein PsorP6_002020 [Peronosclerospora sorghi]|uniref:Uncharacterized protein n=1 Tax=Peronosclerospora sorghi TaxID=230839 RepID=A0ACC0WTB2_9STRA|nr:hypothetical protein PsorP6_002020 [Peronosclerospora sorghi]